MPTKDNIIGFVRDLPRLSDRHQISVMEQYGIRNLIIEGRRVSVGGGHTVEGWNTLVMKTKAGDTIAVARTRVLVPAQVSRFRHQLNAAFNELEDRGVKGRQVIVWDLENGWRSKTKSQMRMMLAQAEDDFQNVARYAGAGQPPKNWNDAEKALVEQHWPNIRRHRTNGLAVDAIRKDAKRLGLTRLTQVEDYDIRNHFGPSGRALVKRKPRDE